MAEKVKKEKSKARKIVEWILFGVFGVACAFVLAANVSGMVNRKKNYGQTIRFGVGTFVILTNSMEPEIHVNDFIITYRDDLSKLTKEFNSGKTLDVTFMNVSVSVGDFEPDTEAFKSGTAVYSNAPMTHRLREIHIDQNKDVGQGHYIFVASGINTGGDYAKEGQYQVFTEKEYLGTVKSSNAGLGKFMNFVSSAWGLIILLLIPGIYLIVISSIDIFKAVKAQEEGEASAIDSHLNNENHLSNISSADRERLKNELLEEMIREKKEGKK